MLLPLALLLTQAPAAPAPDPATAILDAAAAKAAGVRQAQADFVKGGGQARDFKPDLKAALADLDGQLAKEKAADKRSALLVARLYLTQVAREKPEPALLRQIRAEVPAVHPGWKLNPRLILALADEDARDLGPYVAAARAGHPEPAVRRALLMVTFSVAMEAKDEAACQSILATLEKEHPDQPETRQAKATHEAARKTAVGAQVPAFSIAALDQPSVTYSAETFKGRTLLIDFWATWCPPCREEMPAIHAAWAKFKGKPFDILSVSLDRKLEHIAPYRANAATPMPWKHAFVEPGSKHPITTDFGVTTIPKPILVGPDGRILATGSDLRGENLEKTLAKHLK